jgi:glycogen synthase
LACGCHMIVSNAGGLAEATGNYGQIFQMKDQKALTELLLKSFDHHENLKDPGRINYLNHHSKEKVAQEYLTIFKNII